MIFEDPKRLAMEFKADFTGLKLVKLHGMDTAGSVSGVIDAAGHAMEITPWYADCGVTGEDIKCSCGMEVHSQYGYGCWQHGHEQPQELEMDFFHWALYEMAHQWESEQEWLS